MRLDEEGCKMTMFGGRLTIHDRDGALLAEVHRTEGRLYLLKLKVEDNYLLMKADDNSSRLWHLRYGHLNYHFLKKMAMKKLVEGLLPITLPTQLCHSCLAGKQSRIPFPKMTIFRANAPLELVFADICGPIIPPTLGGSQYFLLIVDDYSRLMWVAMMKLKSQALSHFKKFKLLAEVEKGTKIQCLRTDRGGGFNSDEFTSFCLSHGIKRQLTAPYSPQQNGVVERKNQTIMSLVQSMLKEKQLPRELWGEVVSMIVYLLNRSSTHSL